MFRNKKEIGKPTWCGKQINQQADTPTDRQKGDKEANETKTRR